MPMHRIKTLSVVMEDGSQHTFDGEGSLVVVRTLASEPEPLNQPSKPRHASGRIEVMMPVPAEMRAGAIVLPTVKIGQGNVALPEPVKADPIADGLGD